jgi:hypothetical protein
MTTDTPPPGWARQWAAARLFARPMPRKGAWYPVVGEASADRLVLMVNDRKVAIPKRLLELREARPDQFTVVVIPRDALHPGRENFGTRYLVCPVCAGRAPLFGEPQYLTCKSCGHRGEVAWWESG